MEFEGTAVKGVSVFVTRAVLCSDLRISVGMSHLLRSPLTGSVI